MKGIFYFLRIFVFIGCIILLKTYWSDFGWWFIVTITALLIGSDIFLTRKIELYRSHQTQDEHPGLKKINEGQSISVVLKNGKKLTNVIFLFLENDRVYVSKERHAKKNRAVMTPIKVKKIKSIMIVDEEI